MTIGSAVAFVSCLGVLMGIFFKFYPAKKLEVNENVKMQIPDDLKDFLKSITETMHKQANIMGSVKETGDRTHKKIDDVRTDVKGNQQLSLDMTKQIDKTHDNVLEIKTALRA